MGQPLGRDILPSQESLSTANLGFVEFFSRNSLASPFGWPFLPPNPPVFAFRTNEEFQDRNHEVIAFWRLDLGSKLNSA